MVTEGRGTTQTKNMGTRLHLVLEAVQENNLEIRYVNTKRMKPDGLTNPLYGVVRLDH
jgi:hypothetical protein